MVRERTRRFWRRALLILVLGLASCAPSSGGAGVARVAISAGHGPTAPVAPVLTAAGEAEEPATLPAVSEIWVATHAVTAFWDGALDDAAPLGRLPIGSYFLVLGPGVGGRLPVRYGGSTSIPPSDGWVDVAAIGPIPAPGPDWSQPDWPVRRLVLGQRDEVIRGDPSLPLVALTFDAGAGSGAIGELLDVLRGRRVRATFFIAGAFADRYPAIVERIAADGHELANHSYSHPDFRTLTEAQMRLELRRATASIELAAATRVAPLWRPPFGARDDRVLRIVREEGFRSIYWTFDSGDWLASATTDRVRDAVLRQVVPGAIVVHHVSPEATARAMPTIIDELRRRGFELVTVTDLIGP